MPWYSYILFGFERHYIDASLAEPLREKLRATAKELEYENISEQGEEVEQVYFEPGGHGSYAMNQPRMTFELGEKKLEIDCAKAAELLFDLLATWGEELPNGVQYFRCHSRLFCLCLTAEDKESLISQLRLNLNSANQRGDEFMERSEAAWRGEDGKGSFPFLRWQDLPRDELVN